MLRQTFCHLKGIGPRKERALWDRGLRCWEDLDGPAGAALPDGQRRTMAAELAWSVGHLEAGRAQPFGEVLPGRESWRLLPEFHRQIAYLDIETTGMAPPADHITTIALYDGERVRHYVHGQNLERFVEDVSAYEVLVTYNGKCFDVPFIERQFGVRLEQAQIDLRYVLASLGYRGGLKGCERQLGLARGETDGMDGYLAVLLWRDYVRRGREAALETLLAYNVQDVLSLEVLLALAYNQKLDETPFASELRVDVPEPAANPFRADRTLVERLVGW